MRLCTGMMQLVTDAHLLKVRTPAFGLRTIAQICKTNVQLSTYCPRKSFDVSILHVARS